MSELYIGLMSGTSADGIDTVLVDFSATTPKLINSCYTPYPFELRKEILALTQSGHDEITRLGHLDVRLGKMFADTINELVRSSQIKSSDIKAIGSHGQTLRHVPSRFTLQIGDPNVIAAETGITTVADFRRRDMAHGGQGAPLVPAFHKQLFTHFEKSRAIVNIGGIANVTLLFQSNTIGFDTGPGNALLDDWMEKNTHSTQDQEGKWAAQGQINFDLLARLLADPYFEKNYPKSTGREYFNLNWLKQYLVEKIAAVDVQATLTELTALTILKSIPFKQGEIFICGGGVHNDYLMSRIRFHAHHCKVDTTDKLGVHPDWVEAMAFAWLAKQTLAKKSGNLIHVTGAAREAILGGVYF